MPAADIAKLRRPVRALRHRLKRLNDGQGGADMAAGPAARDQDFNGSSNGPQPDQARRGNPTPDGRTDSV